MDILLSGFDRELTFQKLEDSCILLNRGVTWLATNPDWVCPTWYGSVPDCGSVCEMLHRATGREPEVHRQAPARHGTAGHGRTGFPPEAAVLLGDRVYTDIACAVNAEIDSVLVLSGEGTREDVEKRCTAHMDIRRYQRGIPRVGGDTMKLNYKRTILVGFAFFLICAFWQAYDNTIPLILTNKFGMSQTWSGVIMAMDNVLALFLLPLFGHISDKCTQPRRAADAVHRGRHAGGGGGAGRAVLCGQRAAEAVGQGICH